MNALPMVQRELRVSSRNWRTYWVQTGFGLTFALIGGSYCIAFNQIGADSSQLGGSLFSTLIYITFFYAISTGLTNTSDCVSQEKREGTLGLLFLTDLTGWDVILGKLSAKGLKSLNCLLAGLPIMTICLIFGGLTLFQIVCAALAVVNAFFFSHAAGLLSSTLSVKARESYFGGFCIVFFSAVVAPAAATILSSYNIAGWDWLWIFCIWKPLVAAFATSTFRATWLLSSDFFGPLLATHALTWLFLAAASWEIPRCWQIRPPKTPKMTATTASQTKPRRAVFDQNPYCWLVLRGRWRAMAGWLTFGMCALGWIGLGLWLASPSHQSPSRQPVEWSVFIYSFIVLMNVVFRLLVCFESARHFDEQRHDGSMELLLSATPISVETILAGKLQSLKRLFLGPVAAQLALDVVLLIGVMAAQRFQDGWSYVIVGTLILLLPLEMATSFWIGMWRSIVSMKPRRAGGETVVFVFGIPWVLYGMLMLGIALADDKYGLFTAISSHAKELFTFILWVLCMTVPPVILAMMGRRALWKDFRLRANPMEVSSFWTWLGRTAGRAWGCLSR